MMKKILYVLDRSFWALFPYLVTALFGDDFFRIVGREDIATELQRWFELTEGMNWEPIYLYALFFCCAVVIGKYIKHKKSKPKLFSDNGREDMSGKEAINYIINYSIYGKMFSQTIPARQAAARWLLHSAKFGKIKIFGKHKCSPFIKKIPFYKLWFYNFLLLNEDLVIIGKKDEDIIYEGVFFNELNLRKKCPPNNPWGLNFRDDWNERI